jgi:hypothetical protein
LQFCVVVWIGLLVYKTGLVEDAEDVSGILQDGQSESSRIAIGDWAKDFSWSTRDGKDLVADAAGGGSSGTGLVGLLAHETLELWKSLSPNHWRTVFGYYNMSLLGR